MGRNDRLGQGRWGKVEAVEVKGRREAAKNRVGRNDRLSPGDGMNEKVEVEWRPGNQMACRWMSKKRGARPRKEWGGRSLCKVTRVSEESQSRKA